MPRLEEPVWRQILEFIKKDKEHGAKYRRWFENLEPQAVHGGLLRILAAQERDRNYLQNSLREAFMSAAQAVTGRLVAVEFEAAPATPTIQEPEPAPQSMPAPQVNLLDGFVLSPDYTFTSFVGGPNNQLAFAAAQAVGDQPGKAYNPLFIHGGVGLGKTHLLQAICQRILERRPGANIMYVSCDAFIGAFIQCVQDGKMSEFRNKYRHVDVLVVDDIHFLAGKERVQEEFFHTFNTLYQAQKQVVLSSDAAPEEIPELEERLTSRFKWGVVAKVGKPDLDTRVAILAAKAAQRGVELPREVAELVAKKAAGNARELEGALNTLIGHVRLQNRTLDLALAREVLGEPSCFPRSNQAAMQAILDAVTGWYNLPLADLQSRRRHKSVTEPRQLCMWLARRHTRLSLEEIGGFFGGRDHTTVMHSLDAVESRCVKDVDYATQVKQIEDSVRDVIA